MGALFLPKLLIDTDRSWPVITIPRTHMTAILCDAVFIMQVKHPDHSYQGMTDPQTCPDFVNDYDCRSSNIDAMYHSLQQKVGA